jgi:negative regulator of flagellin synthesis FlgM
VANNISGIDGAPSAAQVPSVGAGRAIQRPQDAVSGGTSSSDTSKGGSQNVQITGTARQLSDLDQKVRSLPDVNEEKVAALRSAIEQGTYQVRPQHIADQLMSLERSLGSLPDAEAGA